uniref:Uncharacterized protein n=1 Tax=Picea glauca TaxID=3330 RepID=A0A101LZR0_PICGL|nr:hypothetical protein ABT39_MTgene5341 [Picea glauca]
MNGGCPSLRLLFSSSPAVTLFFLPQARGEAHLRVPQPRDYPMPFHCCC